MSDFDFATLVFLIPGAVGTLVIQHVAMKADAAQALRNATRPVFNINLRVVDDAPWWNFWRNW